MKKWKQKLNSELDRVIPDLSAEVRFAPIEVDEKEVLKMEKSRKQNFTKWAYSLSLSCIVIVFAVCLSVYFGIRNPATNPPQVGNSYTAIVEINPKVMFSVDDSGKVADVTALNTDADVILSSAERLEELKGIEIEKSVKKFVDYCAKLGYIDLDGESAVKISHSGKQDDLIKTVNNVEEYFREKGAHAVVFQKQVTVEKLCEMVGLDVETTANKAIEDFTRLSNLYTSRKWDNMTDQELSDLYNSVVISKALKNIVVSKINRQISVKDQIENINGINEQIKTSENNPQLLLKDYWSVKSFNDSYENFSDEFKWLMIAMDTAIDKCKNEYGIEIKGIIDLEALRTFYSSIDFTAITDALERVTSQNFTEYLPVMTAFLEIVGEDVSFVDEYLNIPKNKEEFSKKSDDYLKSLYNFKEGKNDELYNYDRQQITKEEYDDYVKSIISSYGSMELYWLSLQKQ